MDGLCLWRAFQNTMHLIQPSRKNKNVKLPASINN